MYELYLHGGYQRTGSTFLQEKIFINLKGFDCLGKPHAQFNKTGQSIFNQQGTMIDHNVELYRLQNKIFPRKYSLKTEYPLNFIEDEKKYFNCLLKSITNSKNKKFIFSDETLFDKINYFGDLNIFFLINIINALKEKIEIKVKLILSIRKQSNLLPAIYAYDHYRQKKNFHSFKNFIFEFLNSEDNDYGEIFNFHKMYFRLKKLFNSDILVLPLEELEKQPNKYVEKINSFLNTEFILTEEENRPVKKSSYELENKKVFFLREHTYLNITNFLSNIHEYFLKFRPYQKVMKNSFLIKWVKNFLKSKSVSKKVGEMEVSASQQLEIKRYYEKSNRLLAQETGIDLKSLGYF